MRKGPKTDEGRQRIAQAQKERQIKWRKENLPRAFKKCPCCKQTKPAEEFHLNPSNVDGLGAYCKQCQNQKNKEFRRRYLEKSREKQRGFSYRYFRSPAGRYTAIKMRAKKNNLELSITCQEFIEWLSKQKLECYYCGRILRPLEELAPHRFDSLVIERKDNNKGYTRDNICISCQFCNMIKSNIFTEEEMLEIANKYLKPKMRKDSRIKG